MRDRDARTTYSFRTLPDYLRPGLALVFVGLNPGLFSVQRGHYFARPTSRFWPAFSRSRLSAGIRAALGREVLRPEDDGALLAFGVGFTDVVKTPSRGARDLSQALFRRWAPRLLRRLEAHQPRVACFHGLIAYRGFARYGLRDRRAGWDLGLQPLRVGHTRLIVVPNPSPANAHFRPSDYLRWYDRVAALLRLER